MSGRYRGAHTERASGFSSFLRVLIDDARGASELVLQIERNGQLQFVTCLIY